MWIYPQRLWISATLAVSLASAMAADRPPAWESGKPIPVGTPDRQGPLGVGLTSLPVGWANVTGASQPDLFVVAGRHSFPAGLFLYPWKGVTRDGIPVFGARWVIGHPGKSGVPPICTVVQAHGGTWAFIVEGGEVIAAQFDLPRRAFGEVFRVPLTGLPRSPEAIAALPQPGAKWLFVLGVSDGKGGRPPGADARDRNYFPYDGAGIWRGGTARSSLWALIPGTPPRPLTRPGEEILHQTGRLTTGRFSSHSGMDLISGSRFGDIYYYRNSGKDGLALEPRRHAVDEEGIALRHPVTGAYPLAYPNRAGQWSDLIAGGEGGLCIYRFTGRFSSQGSPVFRKPVAVLEKDAGLFAGSLPVPTVVDWDGDGVLDIVAGNSEGRILFFRNLGTNRLPAISPGVPIRANGQEIHIQPGYKGSVQGPDEARWGYIGPNVFDWNGDGIPDILASDATARHYVFLNRGTRQLPKLDVDRTLYLDGLDLHGTWRTRPGVGKLDGSVAYVALDDEDEFRLYWRLDDYNLSDGGKLRMEDGSFIRANFFFAGGTGRSKIEILDWDNDGDADLLVGTPRHHSIPNPEKGLPRALGLPGTMVLYLKNVGNGREPRFRFPVGLKHDGSNIYLGHHEIGVSAGAIGPGQGINIVVSREDGRLFFFQREHLSPTN